ncbi:MULTISPECIES: hypothetical protein [unclassified Pseudodesulfovibrio]|uniref:hypothetical protein n=1 Tax=unclassified Pseudodesulfovibrio TaxID=2661612 RepID=UPI000FEBFC36|nr:MULTISPECIES: hypothetical protein [unclassified Pseudodesulfovibrio]MCJ2165860.1 hypothetical protein [Pseudodesulfovibrio sp. S3-i]RWU02707.1 hypothetical protein DWB63_14860 [Pseudodesulfovibrio sp. S3]
MAVTPSELFDLALVRHRQPWNWSLHCASMVLFCLTLLAHSYLLLASSMILFGTGFFSLNLGDPPQNRWFGFVAACVEWEKNWVAAPWNWVKWSRLLFVVCLAGAIAWVLWTRELAGIGLLVGFAALVRVVKENKDNGVDL